MASSKWSRFEKQVWGSSFLPWFTSCSFRQTHLHPAFLNLSIDPCLSTRRLFISHTWQLSHNSGKIYTAVWHTTFCFFTCRCRGQGQQSQQNVKLVQGPDTAPCFPIRYSGRRRSCDRDSSAPAKKTTLHVAIESLSGVSIE